MDQVVSLQSSILGSLITILTMIIHLLWNYNSQDIITTLHTLCGSSSYSNIYVVSVSKQSLSCLYLLPSWKFSWSVNWSLEVNNRDQYVNIGELEDITPDIPGWLFPPCLLFLLPGSLWEQWELLRPGIFTLIFLSGDLGSVLSLFSAHNPFCS